MQQKFQKLNSVFLYYAAITTLVFIALIGTWAFITITDNTNIDDSGMGLVLFLIPILCSVIVLIMSICNKKAIKRGNAITTEVVVIMSVLSVPAFVLNVLLLLLSMAYIFG